MSIVQTATRSGPKDERVAFRTVHENPEDLHALQELLDRSYAAAGRHLRGIITPGRRVGAEELAARLTGMRLLALATVTADGRPIVGPVDGIFHRGAFHFGSSVDSVRYRHIRARPQVSATHVPGEEFAVTVHGRAIPFDIGAPDGVEFRRTLLEVYGGDFESFVASPNVFYARIEAERMFTFQMTK